MRVKRKKIEWVILAIAGIAVGIFAVAAPEGTSRLVSVQQLPENLTACSWDESSAANPAIDTAQEESLLAELQQRPSSTLASTLVAEADPQQGGGQRAAGGAGQAGDPEAGADYYSFPKTEQQLKTTAELRAKGARVPVRTIRDTAPTYSSIAVDVNSNEVIMTDNNLWSYRVFDRLSPTPKNDTDVTPPKRIVTGDRTALAFDNGLYVDPVNGDIYSVESDTGDKMERFAREAERREPHLDPAHSAPRIQHRVR